MWLLPPSFLKRETEAFKPERGRLAAIDLVFEAQHPSLVGPGHLRD